MLSEEALAPGLYLVATPLGNLGDLSPRARETLSRASFLASESSSAAGHWLQLLDPQPRPRVLSYREASRDKDAALILRRLEEGAAVALISDAGTPAISDPGWHLVDLARQAGHPVWAVPGPCAAVQALSLAGFPCRRFSFEGFLAASGKARREALARLNREESPVVLYESPHRLLETLGDLATLDPRALFLGRELTKKFEEGWRGSTDAAVHAWREKRVQGEFTLVLGPRPAQAEEQMVKAPEESVSFVRSLGLPAKTSAAILKHFHPQLSKKELYGLFIDRP